jgi:hypothetical protein
MRLARSQACEHVRRSSARARDPELLEKRLDLVIAAHNRNGSKRVHRRIKATQKIRKPGSCV